MQTFPNKIAAHNALVAARLSKLPVEFTVINGEVNVTVICEMQRDIEYVNERGFNARLRTAA